MTEETRRRWRHATAKRLGLWPLYGRMSFAFYAWAKREIRPTNPDAAKVGRRYDALRREFATTTK